ncbi:MAG: Xaa-Pro peptidase family protein [Dehalococcoidia bacterium]|nr:Xaa-Pro peptidase family protein [Dehalococcoidia bacterium]
MSKRLEGLRQQLKRGDIDAILISQGYNRRYLSGFTGSAGLLLITQDRALLVTDFRYIEQAQSEAPEFEIIRMQGAVSQWFPTFVSGLRIQKLGFEDRDVSVNTYKEFTEAISGLDYEIGLVPTSGLVESLRSVKDDEELKYLEQAAALSDAALEEILPGMQPGMSEKALAWELESFLRRSGSEPLPFDIIVASGPNSALPHAKPTERAILENEPVVIDLGARVGGYVSDITRTVCLGEGGNTFRRIYDIVLGAQLTAMATLQAGMNGEQVDQLGRTVIAKAGYKENFGHGLGHGIGLAAHEEPRLGPNSTSIITEGMVFTIEPGIYISGWGGVRIEDTVLITRRGCEVLTKDVPKEIDEIEKLMANPHGSR